MRIRKRQVPFPFSSLSPAPLSDPQFTHSPVVSLQLDKNPHQKLLEEDDTDAYFNPLPPSDQPIGGGSNVKDCFSASGSSELKQESNPDLMEVEERGPEEERSNDTRKGSAEIETAVLQHSSSFHQVVDRWCVGEKTFPLKKRRRNFHRRLNDEEMIIEKDKKMKTKKKKKCMQQHGSKEEEQEEEEEEEDQDNKGTEKNANGSRTNARKRARGGALMEGSRCSRVNGRGWRCCQQTLVGYSLCEHHLGKGRLRSMNSVRRQSTVTTILKKALSHPLSSTSLSSQQEREKAHELPDNETNHEKDDEEEKKPLGIGKKKTKLGMVKARSISSLLGQANNDIAVTQNN